MILYGCESLVARVVNVMNYTPVVTLMDTCVNLRGLTLTVQYLIKITQKLYLIAIEPCDGFFN